MNKLNESLSETVELGEIVKMWTQLEEEEMLSDLEDDVPYFFRPIDIEPAKGKEPCPDQID